MMSAKSVAVVVLLGLSVVAGMSSDAATYYMKAGAGDWSDAANFYVDAERTQTAPHAPQKGDVVYLIGGETYTAQDSNAASFDVFANLDEIRTSPDAQNRFPTLAVTMSEGEKSVGFAYVYDRSGVITSTNSTFVKHGEGTLAFSRINDASVCRASLDIRAGVVKLPQGGSTGTQHGFLNLAAGTTIILTGSPTAGAQSAFMGITTAVGSLITNISTRANTLCVSDNPRLDKRGVNVIAGRVGGNVRPWTQRNIAFLDPANTFSPDPYIDGNKGNLYSEEPWKNVGVYACTTIGGDGSPSSLGPSTFLNFRENGGGLRYLGTGERATRRLSLLSSVYPHFVDGGPNGNLELVGALDLGTKRSDVCRFFFIGTNLQTCVWAGAMNEPKSESGDVVPAHITKAGSGTWRFADNAQRLHHGGTTIADGTLEFDSIAPKGQMCSLGYSDLLTPDDSQAVAKGAWVDYAFTLGGTNSAGQATKPVFAYNGTASAWITNRPIALAFGGGALRGSNQGGYLAINGILARDAGAEPTLTLDGDSANCGRVGDISDGAANARVSVAKTGAGTWRLGGGLSFSGDLSVNDGTLDVLGAVSRTNTYFRITIKGVGNGGKSVACRQFALYDASGNRRNIGLIARTNEAARTASSPAIVRSAVDLLPGEAAYAAPLTYKLSAGMPNKPDTDLDGLFATVAATSSDISHQYGISTSKNISRDDSTSWVCIVLRLADDCPPITHFDIQQMASGTDSCPKYVVIEGSSDGQAWQTLFDNTETGFDFEKGYLTYNANDTKMCCYCCESGHADGEEGCAKAPNGKHVVKGFNAPVGVNKWISTGGDGSSVSVTAVRPYEEGVRCFAFAQAAQISEIPSALPNVSYVSVAAGAVLNLPAGTTLSKLRVDVTGMGTIRGAAFEPNGIVDLVNFQSSDAGVLSGDFVDCTGLDNLGSWQVTRDGVRSSWKIRVDGNRLTVMRPGLCLVVR